VNPESFLGFFTISRRVVNETASLALFGIWQHQCGASLAAAKAALRTQVAKEPCYMIYFTVVFLVRYQTYLVAVCSCRFQVIEVVT